MEKQYKNKRKKVYKHKKHNLFMKRGTFALILTFIILINISFVLADGGYFPPPGHWVRPGQQKAIIFHEDNTETLIVTSDFRGNAEDLVWIIPTPTQPKITKANEQIFSNIAELTRPQYSSGLDFGTRIMTEAGIDKSSSVVVLSSEKVDYYNVTVVMATDSKELSEWFNEHNYTYPKEYEYVLNHYIKKGWKFTAIKISPEAQTSTEVELDLREGHPTPVKLTFLSEKIVYPLKISAVEFKEGFKISTNLELNKQAIEHLDDIGYEKLAKEETAKKIFNQIIADRLADKEYSNSIARNYSLIIPSYEYSSLLTQYCNYESCVRSNLEADFRNYFSRNRIYLSSTYNYNYVPIYLYVISDSKQEADNFYTRYANWVDGDEIKDLGDDENGNPLIQPEKNKYFLTYLYASLQKSQMDDDVFLEKADNNNKVNAGPETWEMLLYGLIIGFFIFLIWIFTPIGIMFIAGSLILTFSSNKTARIFGWIMNILSIVLTLLIGLIFFIIFIVNGAISHYATISSLITTLFILAITIIISILLLKHTSSK
jgi:hypothetical protein